MAEQLFLFIQLEYPWVLGPPDGRYLLRDREGAEPEHVLVLATLGARRAPPGGRGRAAPRRRMPTRRRVRWTASAPSPEPALLATTRATIVDPVSVSAERQARAWLEDLDPDRQVGAAVSVLNRALYSYRLASADPHTHEVTASQAILIRAGWGEGEQVAYGRWLHARELEYRERARPGAGSVRRAGRSAALRTDERVALLLGERTPALLCEELALRARLDLEHGRLRHAAIELDRALAAALPELQGEGRHDLALRIGELEKLRPGVGEQAAAAMASLGRRGDAVPAGAGGPLQEEVVRHALERLEAALRARTASGLDRSG